MILYKELTQSCDCLIANNGACPNTRKGRIYGV